MEFLLQSQKRNRTWVMLKQLSAAAAADAGRGRRVLLMAAQPQARNSLGALLGGSKTHHIVLLDDSYSMSDHWADTSAFKQAIDVVGRLGKQLSRQGGQQEFTLLAVFASRPHRGQGLQSHAQPRADQLAIRRSAR